MVIEGYWYVHVGILPVTQKVEKCSMTNGRISKIDQIESGTRFTDIEH